MINLKEDISNSVGRVLFMILFFFLIYAFADKSVKPDHKAVQTELNTDLNCASIKAIVSNRIQLPLFQKNWLSQNDNKTFKFFSENLKVLAYNKKTNQRIIYHQLNQDLIKPITKCRFYTHLFPITGKEPPRLS